MSNGIDTALYHLSSACCSLESSRPGLAEVKAAKKAAKTAHDLLDACETFIANSVYTVCEEPKGPYVDPADHRIEMPELPPSEAPAEVKIELDQPLPPLPDLVGDFDQLHPEMQEKQFHTRFDSLCETVRNQGGQMVKGFQYPWYKAFDVSRLDTYARLVYAMEHRQPASIDFPEDEEMATWRAGFTAPLPPLPDELMQFDTWDEGDATDEFSRRLEALGEGVNFDAWTEVWDRDHRDAFTRLLVAEARQDVSQPGLLPTEMERDEWLARHAPAPAAKDEPAAEEEAAALDEEARRHQLFEDKLAELEEVGVRESALKRKNWKKAEKAWRLEFAGDPAATMDKLLWRLSRPVVVWDIPTNEEFATAPEAEKESA